MRDNAEAVDKSRRGDPEVVSTEALATPFEVGPNLGVRAGDRLCDRHRLELCEHVLDEGAPAIAAGSRRPVDAVEQLAHGDDADRPLFVADERLELGGPGALPRDQNRCVDQDGQGLSGGPTDVRSARISSANSASTEGADAMIARNRSAERSRGFGGEMTATGAPARVTSISSPAETRFSTSEKRRATSVAVSRITSETYQINLIRTSRRRWRGSNDCWRRTMAKKRLTKAERAEWEAQRARMLANAQRTHEVAERAQAKLDAKASQR